MQSSFKQGIRYSFRDLDLGLAEKPSDDILKKLVKRIPTDIVTMYIAARWIFGTFQDQNQKLLQNGLCCSLNLLVQWVGEKDI